MTIHFLTALTPELTEFFLNAWHEADLEPKSLYEIGLTRVHEIS